MTHDEAVAIVLTGARYWLTELDQYIIPASEDAQDGADYTAARNSLENAIQFLERERKS
jgi:hypothetical protein